MVDDFKKAVPAAVLAALAASGAMFWALANGPGVSHDSTVYLATARSLSSGQGFLANAEPMTHFPPAYPLILAFAGLFDDDLLRAARLLHSLLFGLNVLLVGLTAFMSAGRNVWLAALCAGAFFLNARLVEIHGMAWSEPPFFSFFLAAYLLLSIHICRPRSLLLFGAGLFLGLAMTTRYAGVALLPPMIGCLLFFGGRPIKQRLKDCAIVTVMGCAPLAAWVARNMAMAGTAANRSFALKPITSFHVDATLDTMIDFWFPVHVRGWLVWVMLLIAATIVVTSLVVVQRKRDRFPRRYERRVAEVFRALGLAFCATYVALIFVAVALMEEPTLSQRMFSPVNVVTLLVVVSLLYSVIETMKRAVAWKVFLALFIALTLANGYSALSALKHIREQGRGFTARVWRESESIEYVRSLPARAEIYSNAPDAVNFLTGREARFLPRKTVMTTQEPSDGFRREMTAVYEAVRQGGAVVVFLEQVDWRWYLPSREDLDPIFRLLGSRRLADGTVYGNVSSHSPLPPTPNP